MRWSVAAGAGLAVAGILYASYRRWHTRWGATGQELRLMMPGDEIVEHPAFDATRAITITARPEEVWPWLVQVGFNRAGFYSYDLLDNLGRPSSERIIPELQHIEIGSWIPMAGKVNEETAFRVKAFEPDRWMLWQKPSSTWAWKLEAIDEHHTRLVTRLRCEYRWIKPTIVADLLIVELGDFPMMRKMLLGIKRRAERLHRGGAQAADAVRASRRE